MIQPTLAEVEKLGTQGNLVPIYQELPADLETPVSVYLKLQDEGPSFLLESITGSETVARYSFIGVRPHMLISAVDGKTILSRGGSEMVHPAMKGSDPMSILRSELAKYRFIHTDSLPRFTGGAVGFLSYDAVRRFEHLPATAVNELHLPEAIFMLTDSLVAFDHARQRLLVIANVHLDNDISTAYRRAAARINEITARLSAPVPFAGSPILETSAIQEAASLQLKSNFDQPGFEAIVRKAQEYIAAGEIFQVVLSQRLSGETTAQPFDIYRALRLLNPSPYMVFLRYPGGLGTPPLHVIAASPEMHARLENGVAELRPIAGTRPRGATPAEDTSLAHDLLSDEKERSEHVMLVDLGRNDLGRVCEYGSVQVKKMMMIENYSHVMHLVSEINGRMHPGQDAFDLMRATFPAGTLSGAPKVRAMEIIEELEGVRRGLYGGTIFYVDYSGNMDSCITIRTAVMQGSTVHIQSGAGIVAESVPELEYAESLNKARALKEAVLLAQKGGVR